MSLIRADARRIPLRDGCVQCVVTSPPYFGLRDYGVSGQIGMERTHVEYVSELVEVFREVRRVLAEDGVFWLNLGDTYNAYNGNAGPSSSISKGRHDAARPDLLRGHELLDKALKPKDLIGIPWRVVFALQSDGWYLRSDIIWSKPNPMPESVTDRPTKAHEYLFLLAKSERYYYDADAIREPHTSGENTDAGLEARQHIGDPNGRRGHTKSLNDGHDRTKPPSRPPGYIGHVNGRNRRSVWAVAVQPYHGAHFATFPEALVEPCILAGSRHGDLVFDPFGGTGTVVRVARRLGRRGVACELNPAYLQLAKQRIVVTGGLPLEYEANA